MFIETETTPNPASLKFLPGRAVAGDLPPLNLTRDEDAAARSPLAARLMTLPEVEGVFLGRDFITVTKRDQTEWVLLKPRILGILLDHFLSEQPVLTPESADASAIPSGLEDEITTQIRELLETRVRPVVAQDGGDIVFERFEDGVVWLQMYGSCSGCPSSTMTLKSGIENLLTHYIPEVREVRAVPR